MNDNFKIWFIQQLSIKPYYYSITIDNSWERSFWYKDGYTVAWGK